MMTESMKHQDAPPPVASFIADLARWLEEQKFQIPIQWDSKNRLVVFGDPAARTRARYTEDELTAEDGATTCLEGARSTIENWKRLFENPSVFDKLPPSNRKELSSYFGSGKSSSGKSSPKMPGKGAPPKTKTKTKKP